MPSIKHLLRHAALAALGAYALLFPPAHAVPAFASQTGQQCAACHVGGNWPALTPWGRFFKLSGYTAGQGAFEGGKFNFLPMGLWGQIGATWVNDSAKASGPNGAVRPKEATVHLAGKITDFAGAFLEYTAHYGAGSSPAWTKGSDVMDLRAVHFFELGGHELLMGLNANAGPGMQDVWNTSWAWSFPFYGSPFAPGTAVNPIVSQLANNATGIGAYAWLDRSLYAELSFYRTSLGAWRFMSWGNSPLGVTVDGYNPYWRLTYSMDLGPGNLMLGTLGMHTEVYPNALAPSGPTNQYTDLGFDAQYQYLTEVHKLTVRASYLHEKRSWNASFPAGSVSERDGHVSQLNLNAAYWRGNQWGLTAGYITSRGSSDALLYGATTPSPNSNNWVLEFDYMLTQNIKLMAQYNAFTKFNGVSSGASDNNSLFLNAFIAY